MRGERERERTTNAICSNSEHHARCKDSWLLFLMQQDQVGREWV